MSAEQPAPPPETAELAAAPPPAGGLPLEGLRVVEVPITFVEREIGDSKMSRDIVVEALWRVTVWGAQHRGRQVRELLEGARRR